MNTTEPMPNRGARYSHKAIHRFGNDGIYANPDINAPKNYGFPTH